MEAPNNQAGPADNPTISSPAGSAPSPVAAALQREHPGCVKEIIEALGETTIIVPRELIVTACAFLKAAPGLEFNFLADLCGFDRGLKKSRGLKSTIISSRPPGIIVFVSRWCSPKMIFTSRRSQLSGGRRIGTSERPTICSA